MTIQYNYIYMYIIITILVEIQNIYITLYIIPNLKGIMQYDRSGQL